ncbi:MAG: 1-(5-phosphoribosyl)-5-[(5-phosphoribosylamino)methylideneamino]imidazole-4-carboxamide isomerase [Gammaproteobacteria bacterium]|nr:1-(5-phosphoribosyl)-5-[(5-phosphoribosylamino)methylideneamino]imidazole-4-carboxamide isomerase [Gammaproteobacteria bacterium]
MLIIPAIDIKDGHCVRLRQGVMTDDTIYSAEPLAMAARWVEAGARRLHLVDLNGAVEGRPVNFAAIGAIAKAFPQVPIEVGGGIRDEDTIQRYLSVGVRYIIIGTKAVTTPHFVEDMCLEFPGHILVGLDVRDGKVAIEGWSKLARHDAVDLAKQFEQDGVEAIIFTDIRRDGMMTGLNLEATVEFARHLTIPVIASGGVTNLEDIRALCAVESEGIAGAVTGRAIYEGTLDLRAAQQLADELTRG